MLKKERQIKVSQFNISWRRFFLYILSYSVLFGVMSYFIFSDFREADKTFLWATDGMCSYFPRLVYISQTVRNGIQSIINGEGWTIPLYDFRIGPTQLDIQVEPIQWLAVLWPWDQIDVLYDALVILRYYLLGTSFLIMGFYFGQKLLPVLIGTVSYTFCGFAIYSGVTHPFFMSPMFFLPLLIIGTEKIIKKNRSLFFIILVFFAAISNLYFACMLAILVVIYAFVRFPSVYHENRLHEFSRMLGRLAISGGLGIILSGVFLIPTLLQMIGTGRIGRSITSFTNLWVYADSYYNKFVSSFSVIPNDISAWTCLGFSVLTIPAIMMLFLDKSREKVCLKILFLVLTGMLLIPAVAYVMSGFNAILNRWGFAYALCVCTILMFELPDIFGADKRTLKKMGIGIIAYFIICYFIIDHQYYIEAPFVLLACSMTTLIFLRSDSYQKFLLCSLIITCFSVYYSAFLMYDATQSNYIAEFTSKNMPYQYYEQSQYNSAAQCKFVRDDDSFYRIAGDSINGESTTSSFYSDIKGLSFYSSIPYQPYMKWLKEMEVTQLRTNIWNYGIMSRSPLLSLANVKYYVLRNDGGEVPLYGFQEIDYVKNGEYVDIVMENAYFLPVGYTYETYILQEQYDEFFPLKKQEAQLQAIVLSEEPASSLISKGKIYTNVQKVPITLADCRGISWKDGVLKVKENGATLTLAFEGLPKTETYLRIVNLDLTNGASSRRWYLTATTDTSEARARFTADGWIYSHGMKTQLLDLGYTEDGYTTCTITFPSKGTFKLEDLEIWCQPMDHYGEQIDALREEVLENIETNWRGLSGTISVSKDKMLCLAIPYDKGWTAYIDGEKVKLYQANTAFMAVELSAGDHEVELRYWMPGLTVGIVLSCFGMAALVALVIYRRKKGQTQLHRVPSERDIEEDII